MLIVLDQVCYIFFSLESETCPTSTYFFNEIKSSPASLAGAGPCPGQMLLAPAGSGDPCQLSLLAAAQRGQRQAWAHVCATDPFAQLSPHLCCAWPHLLMDPPVGFSGEPQARVQTSYRVICPYLSAPGVPLLLTCNSGPLPHPPPCPSFAWSPHLPLPQSPLLCRPHI